MDELNNKTVMLISPQFHGIYNLIINKMKEMGINVIYYDSLLSNNGFIKILTRLAPKFSTFLHQRYYKKIIKENEEKNVDYLLVIKGEILPKGFLKEIAIGHKNIKKILYLYDSIRNYPQILSTMKWFDEVYSFDREDVEKYNLKFRPLFFADQFALDRKNEYKYDISFVGTVHSDRYLVLNKIRERYQNKYNLYLYLYIQMKMIYYVKHIFLNAFRKASIGEFKFKSLSHADSAIIYNSTKCIIDIQQKKQIGLSMRSIEALGAKKKLITTNEDIKNYDFYNHQNILIINRDNIQIPDSFIYSDYIDVDEEILAKYSLEKFVRDLLFSKQNKFESGNRN